MAISFSVLKKQRKTLNQRSNKRAREETEDTNPTVIITQVSTATITNETVNQNRKKLIVNTTKTSASKSKDISKNENTASVLYRGQQENINLFTVINFVKQTIQTLTNYREQVKTQLDFSLTRIQLLNKNFKLCSNSKYLWQKNI